MIRVGIPNVRVYGLASPVACNNIEFMCTRHVGESFAKRTHEFGVFVVEPTFINARHGHFQLDLEHYGLVGRAIQSQKTFEPVHLRIPERRGKSNLTIDAPRRDYRKRGEGKTKNAALRALKRRLATVVYRRMLTDAELKAAGPAGHWGTALISSVTGSHPFTGSSEKSLAGPTRNQPNQTTA